MNKYYITFLFKNQWQFVDFTANQLANAILDSTDDIADFIFESKEQYFEKTIYAENGERYQVVFSIKNPRTVSVYYPEDHETEGTLVEADIPWLLLKVEDEKGKELYNLTHYI